MTTLEIETKKPVNGTKVEILIRECVSKGLFGKTYEQHKIVLRNPKETPDKVLATVFRHLNNREKGNSKKGKYLRSKK